MDFGKIKQMNIDNLIYHEEIDIKDESIWDWYKDIPGVWGIINKEGQIIDVHASKNIRNEILSHIKYLGYAEKVLLRNGHINDINDNRVKSKVRKYIDILIENKSIDNIGFVIFYDNEDFEECLLVETIIGVQHNCKYWHF